MADPITKKIDTLSAFTEVASGDKLLGLDVSETDPTLMTKLLPLNLVKIFAATQLSADVVENTAIKDLAVTNGKIANATITGAKLVNNTVTETQLATAVNADIALATQRTVMVRLFASDETVVLKTFTNEFVWPSSLDGWTITKVNATLSDPSSSGNVVVTASGISGGSVTIGETSYNGTDTTVSQAVTSYMRTTLEVTSAGADAMGLVFIFMVEK